jgi:gas vesicle protein
MSQQEKNNAFLVGMIVGSSIATIVTLLLTPRNGEENRKIVSKTAQALPEMAEDISSTLQLKSDRLSQSALQKWDNTLNRLKKAITAGVEASQNYRD